MTLPRAEKTKKQSSDSIEWLGGQYGARGGTRSIVWLELPSQVLLSLTAVEGEDELAFGETLTELLAEDPGRPSRIRVPEQAMADAVRTVTGGTIPTVVAPVPEADAVWAAFQDWEEAKVAEWEKLTEPARMLFSAAPWTFVLENQLIAVEIPELGVEDYILSVIGSAGESLGIMLFQSIDDFDGMVDFISLSFEDGEPALLAIDRKQEPRAIEERDVQILAACAAALPPFFDKHRALFAMDEPPDVSETLEVSGVTVTLSAPW